MRALSAVRGMPHHSSRYTFAFFFLIRLGDIPHFFLPSSALSYSAALAHAALLRAACIFADAFMDEDKSFSSVRVRGSILQARDARLYRAAPCAATAGVEQNSARTAAQAPRSIAPDALVDTPAATAPAIHH